MPNFSRTLSPTRSSTTVTVADVDAIKTAIATAAAPATYSGADLNGVLGASPMNPAHTMAVTTAVSAATYNIVDAIVITGSYGGVVVTQSLTPTDANGGETLSGTQPFDAVTSIAVPAQNDAGGQFEFGTFDIVAPAGSLFMRVRVGTAGAVAVGYQDGATDTFASFANGEREELLFERLFAAGTTATNLTLYY